MEPDLNEVDLVEISAQIGMLGSTSLRPTLVISLITYVPALMYTERGLRIDGPILLRLSSPFQILRYLTTDRIQSPPIKLTISIQLPFDSCSSTSIHPPRSRPTPAVRICRAPQPILLGLHPDFKTTNRLPHTSWFIPFSSAATTSYRRSFFGEIRCETERSSFELY